MQSKSKKLVLLVLLISWLALFFNLTPLVLTISGRALNKSTLNTERGDKDVVYWIDSLNINENLLKEVFVIGWAFIDTVEDNPEKVVKLILASPDKRTIYEKEMSLYIKGGLDIALPNNKVPSERTGITTVFSPLGMKDGNYDLFFYVFENKGNEGIIDTGRDFLKSGNSFIEIGKRN